MRIAHVTDIHVLMAPRIGQLFSKRLVGSANLYLFGRRDHFTVDVQESLVDAVSELAPDAIFCTGDLTAQATVDEFEAARRLLGPLFESCPSVVIPGNHDVYTRGAYRDQRIESYFGEWMGEGEWPRVHLVGSSVAAVSLDVCRSRLDSAGVVSADQLTRLDQALSSSMLDGRFVFVLLHYPLRGRRGEPYGPSTRDLRGARQLEEVLIRRSSRVHAVLHGHEHHGFRTTLPVPGGGIPIFNPGASGYAWLPEQNRTAHFNVYTVKPDSPVEVERFGYDGEKQCFLPESGGAYSTGR